MSSASTSSTIDLAQSAYNLGPFLFAILFVTTITLLAQRAYINAKDQKRTETFRVYFYSSFIFGFLLVMACVSWWIYDRISVKSYVYNVHIRGFDKIFGTLVSQDAYSQGETVADVLPVVNLVIIRKQPIQIGQSIQIELYPAEASGADSDVKYILVPISGYDNAFQYSNGKLLKE
jgi:hypothetical protein